LKFRPVQIRFERCLGSATALSLQRPSPFCHPEGNRGICSPPFVRPAPAGPQPPTIITESSWKHQPRLCLSAFPGEVRGTADPSASPDFLSRVRLRSTACGSLYGEPHKRSLVRAVKQEIQATLGMTERGGSLQGQGGCWMKQWLLNRRIVQIECVQLFQPSPFGKL
jgi:hypothetical protein